MAAETIEGRYFSHAPVFIADHSGSPVCAYEPNIGSHMAESGDIRKLYTFAKGYKYRISRLATVSKGIDTNATATTSIKLDLVIGSTTNALQATTTTANSGAFLLTELETEAVIGEVFDCTADEGVLQITATAAAATAGTAGEYGIFLTYHIVPK